MIATITFSLFLAGVIFFGAMPYFSIFSKKKKEKMCKMLSREGEANGLVFCSQEIFQDKVMGFDGIHRKILILEKDKHHYNSSIIALDEVHHCQLVTPEGTFEAEDCRHHRGNTYSGKIELQFQFNDFQKSASISLANGLIKSKRELALLSEKAQYWCVMFSKMLKASQSARA
ncbi:MAG TPA: hypothetical protein VFD44_03640 [Hanamia sp.]|nr:hypothetical protein [Hanamia sp.]